MKKIILISIFAFIISGAFAQFQDSLFVYKSGTAFKKFGFNQIDTIVFKSSGNIDSIFFYKNNVAIYKEALSLLDSLNRYDKFGRVIDIDGNIYRTIRIGDRIWMAENLKVTTLKDGTHIDEITNQASWAAMTTPAMCWYNNDKASSFVRNGALYNWFTVDTKKLCPTAWHVPSQNEFNQMTNDAGSDGNLRMPGTEYWTAPNTGATNKSGFSLYPSGYRNSARFEDVFNYSNYAYFWMSNQYSLQTGKIMSVTLSSYMPISFPAEYKEEGYSVRCVKNTVPSTSMTDVSKTYGDASFMLNAVSTISGTVFTYAVDSGAAATIYSNGYTTILNAGKVKIKVTSAATDIYDENTFYAYLLISPRTLIIKVGNQSKIVGQPNPIYNSITPTGFASGEVYYSSDGSIFGEYLTFTTTATVNSPIGQYPIVASGTSPNPNYKYVFVNGTLSVNNPGPIPYAPAKDIDGNTYNTVVIGSQIWMTENLRTTKLRDGTKIPNLTDANAYNTLTTAGMSWYNNDSVANSAKYGGLYNWYSVNTKQLCPVSWHVPSYNDWDTLVNYLGAGAVGGKLKSVEPAAWVSPNIGATNSSMFNAVGAGLRTSTGLYSLLNSYTDWWTSSESASGAYYTELSASNSGFTKTSTSLLKYGYSVRCLKNDTVFAITNFKDTSVEYGNISIYGYEGIIFQAQSNVVTEAIYSVVSGDAVSLDNSSNSIGYFKIKKAGTALIKVTFSATIDYPAFSKTITVIVRKKTITLKPNPVVKIEGTQNPVIPIDGTGFSYGDNSSKIDVLPTITTTATQSSPVGKYLITLSGGSDDCYNLQLLTDSLQVILSSNAVQDIQGNVYRTVTIGSQTWMADNLKTVKLNDNTPIPLTADPYTWSSKTSAAYCWYNNDSVSNSYAGPLYNFYAVQTNKLCPVGWHVPTDAEWTQLENYLIANGFNFDGTVTLNRIAKSLSSNALTDWPYLSPTIGDVANNISLNNRTGFNAKPTGSRSNYSSFTNYNFSVYYWTSTISSTTKAWMRNWNSSNSSGTSRYSYEYRYGYSVRCVKD